MGYLPAATGICIKCLDRASLENLLRASGHRLQADLTLRPAERNRKEGIGTDRFAAHDNFKTFKQGMREIGYSASDGKEELERKKRPKRWKAVPDLCQCCSSGHNFAQAILLLASPEMHMIFFFSLSISSLKINDFFLNLPYKK